MNLFCVYKTKKLPNTALFKPFPYHWRVTAPAIAPDTQKKLNKCEEQMNKPLNNLYTQPSSWLQNNLMKRWIWTGHGSTYLWSLHSCGWGRKIEMRSRPTRYTLFQAWMGYPASAYLKVNPKQQKQKQIFSCQSLGESPQWVWLLWCIQPEMYSETRHVLYVSKAKFVWRQSTEGKRRQPVTCRYLIQLFKKCLFLGSSHVEENNDLHSMDLGPCSLPPGCCRHREHRQGSSMFRVTVVQLNWQPFHCWIARQGSKMSPLASLEIISGIQMLEPDVKGRFYNYMR